VGDGIRHTLNQLAVYGLPAEIRYAGNAAQQPSALSLGHEMPVRGLREIGNVLFGGHRRARTRDLRLATYASSAAGSHRP
jgi:hypothetical protein